MVELMNTDNLALRPNCLLTKYPLAFISGPRSLFHHERLGAGLQDFLAAHGYRVFCPVLPFRSSALRREVLRKWLAVQVDKNFHFFLSPKTQMEFGDLLQSGPETTFTNAADFAKESPSTPLHYRLHELFCLMNQTRADSFKDTVPFESRAFCDRILDHCIELAENE